MIAGGNHTTSVFELSADTGRFSSSAGHLLPRFQHESIIWVRLFSLSKAEATPIPRCRDCNIAFKNCRSFLQSRNCRRTVSTDPTQRQPTIRNEQIKAIPLSIGKLGRIHRILCKGIGTRVRQREVHLRRLGGAKILIGAGVLHLIKGIPEHLVMGFFPV